MIPKECPFNDKKKLKLTLQGKPKVCPGSFEKKADQSYEKIEACKKCTYHDGAQMYAPYVPISSGPLLNTWDNNTTYSWTTTSTDGWQTYEGTEVDW
jgi:hypothetical protein